MWPFKKAVEKRKNIETLYIPDGKRAELYELLDYLHCCEIENTGRKMARYELWSFIHDCFPNTQGKIIEINTSDIMSPIVAVRDKEVT